MVGKELEPGEVIANRYRLVNVVGVGAMGKVWEAEPVDGGEHVALKALYAKLSDDETRARFEREFRVMADLGKASPHITRVLDRGVLPSGNPYVVMELLRGEGLDVVLKREKTLPFADVADLVTQLCEAVEALHGAGYVHRDLKPGNVYLLPRPNGARFLKLIDFGTAKALAEPMDHTGVGRIVGTPDFMAPEQFTNEVPVDTRADLFAIGAIAYRAATGKLPFGKGPVSERAGRILAAVPERPSVLNPQLPRDFDDFIERALAKRPVDRFPTATKLAASLQRIAEEHEPIAPTPEIPPLPPLPVIAPDHAREAPKPKGRAAVVALLVVALLGIAAWLLHTNALRL